ncbi:electron transfer flavoprotein subunit beta [candidate division KSB3 bacterium]|uniref:Electron transfer flavoprotein subunit beta n=1 Tax=candidate division KSB3 bacterium TaxID=2044937 RepID=A0A9D5JUX9_9BACT|nr:electron transfer flavoprotein subunit beta [candidate division KSB3 bacterium]MBD3324603.1 electron transfer flavoprotein subunit beta [candidate division KSB3 bacterium]
MKIVVCIKQVPDTTNVRINPETNTLIREGVESIINPFDEYAIEEGIRLKETYGGETFVLSMGPPQVETALKDALSLGGIDDAYLLSDRGFAGADTLATAYTLAAGIRKLGGADIILMGRQAIDGDTGQVGPGLAENLKIPHVTDIRKIEQIDDDGTIVVERLLEDGYVRLKTKLPVVLTVVKEINEPRLPSLRTKMKARKKEIITWNTADLELEQDRIGLTGSPTQVIKIFSPPKAARGKIFEGETSQAVTSLLQELRKAGIELDKTRRNGNDGND